MVELDLRTTPPSEAYRLLIGTIVPRPIAWVSTISSTGVTNLAPFSFFTGVCGDPPSLLICPVNNSDGTEKDTLRNIRSTKQFVVNIANKALAEQMNNSSAPYPFGESEFTALKIDTAPSKVIRAPRVANSPASFECELLQIIDLEPENSVLQGHIVIGRIVYAHYRNELYNQGRVDFKGLNAIARLGGQSYCEIESTFELERPRSPKK